jgi:glucose/arabinose dehydrogenase
MLSAATSSVLLFALPLFHTRANAQSSCSALSPSSGIKPTVAEGYAMQVVATGLSDPRAILLDGAGNLLVIEQGRGVISSHVLDDTNGCVTTTESSDVTEAIGVSFTTLRKKKKPSLTPS